MKNYLSGNKGRLPLKFRSFMRQPLLLHGRVQLAPSGTYIVAILCRYLSILTETGCSTCGNGVHI